MFLFFIFLSFVLRLHNKRLKKLQKRMERIDNDINSLNINDHTLYGSIENVAKRLIVDEKKNQQNKRIFQRRIKIVGDNKTEVDV